MWGLLFLMMADHALCHGLLPCSMLSKGHSWFWSIMHLASAKLESRVEESTLAWTRKQEVGLERKDLSTEHQLSGFVGLWL
jgi:hypothetical protein